MKKLFLVLASIILACAMVSCGSSSSESGGGETVAEETPTIPTSISLTADKTTIKAKETLQLTVTVEPSDAVYGSITYSSSNEDVATVSDTGLVTGVAQSDEEVTITATVVVDEDTSLTAEYTLTVDYADVEYVFFENINETDGVYETTVPGQKDEPVSFTAKTYPDTANQSIIYSVESITIYKESGEEIVVSSDNLNDYISSDTETGTVTITRMQEHDNYDIEIKATADADTSKYATLKVTVTTDYVYVEKITVIETVKEKLENYMLVKGIPYDFDYSISPENASNHNIVIKPDGVATYSASDNTITFLQTGEYTITVAPQDSPDDTDRSDTINVNVAEGVSFDVTELLIRYNNITMNAPKDSTGQPDYYHSNVQFAVYVDTTSTPTLKVAGKMELALEEFTEQANFTLNDLRYRYFDNISLTTVKVNQDDTWEDLLQDLFDSEQYSYTLDFDLGDDNQIIPASSNNYLYFGLEKQDTYNAVVLDKERKITPIYFDDPYSIFGTYGYSSGDFDDRVIFIDGGGYYGYVWGGASTISYDGDDTITVTVSSISYTDKNESKNYTDTTGFSFTMSLADFYDALSRNCIDGTADDFCYTGYISLIGAYDLSLTTAGVLYGSSTLNSDPYAGVWADHLRMGSYYLVNVGGVDQYQYNAVLTKTND